MLLYYCCCCFFFFKQKTAYDMRISDWSSDVCSSNLRDNDVDSCGLTIEGISHEFYKAFANRSIHVDAQCLKHPTLYFQGESGGSRDVRRIGIWGLIMHHACLAQVMTLAKEDQAAFFTLVATSIADRSEEHTYELQSLMRITNA